MGTRLRSLGTHKYESHVGINAFQEEEEAQEEEGKYTQSPFACTCHVHTLTLFFLFSLLGVLSSGSSSLGRSLSLFSLSSLSLFLPRAKEDFWVFVEVKAKVLKAWTSESLKLLECCFRFR